MAEDGSVFDGGVGALGEIGEHGMACITTAFLLEMKI
jgi:hypothetical protein